MLTMLQKKGRGSKAWAVRQGKYTKIHLHLLRIIHLEISIQNISLVLCCESHPKCKSKATDNCIKRTSRKVNNHYTRKYKHHCFPPGGNNTSPSLMFPSLKLDIRGLNPQSSITLPLGVAINHYPEMENIQELLKNSNIKEKNQKYYHHNLNIVS